jgi:type II secretory pathway component PulM
MSVTARTVLWKNLSQQARALKSKLITFFRKLTVREQRIVVGGCIAVVVVSMWWLQGSMSDAFRIQTNRLSQLSLAEGDVAMQLERLRQLQGRLREVEKNFEKPGPQEGVRSYLENLVTQKAKVASGYSIVPASKLTLGGNYEQARFSIEFPTSDFEGLIAFLEELINGPQSLLVTRLDIMKNLVQGTLFVKVEASSIQKGANIHE